MHREYDSLPKEFTGFIETKMVRCELVTYSKDQMTLKEIAVLPDFLKIKDIE
jgi:hypothetical protein